MQTNTLRDALAELDAAWEQNLARRAELETALREQNVEHERLLIARDALRQLLGESPTRTPDPDPPSISLSHIASALGVEVDSDPRTRVQVEAQTQRVPPVRTEDRTTGRPERTVDGIGLLLQESAERDVHIADLRKEFERRGWHKPGTKVPDAAVYAAAKRAAHELPHVVRTGRYTWRWTSNPSEVPAWTTPSRSVATPSVAAGESSAALTPDPPAATADGSAEAPEGQKESPWAAG